MSCAPTPPIPPAAKRRKLSPPSSSSSPSMAPSPSDDIERKKEKEKPLPLLPPENLEMIFAYVSSKSALVAFCGVSKMYRSLARPRLYRSITVTPWKNEVGSLRPKPSKATDTTHACHDIERRVAITCGREFKIDTISVQYHARGWSTKRVPLPALRVVRLDLTYQDGIHPPSRVGKECWLLSDLSPTKLVLRGGSPYHVSFGRAGIPDSLYIRTREIVFITRPKTLKNRPFSYHPYRGVKANIHRLVWILHTPCPGVWWGPNTGNPERPSSRFPSLFDFSPMAQAIASFTDAQIIIVHTRAIKPNLFQDASFYHADRQPMHQNRFRPDKEFQQRLLQALDAQSVSEGQDRAAVDQRKARSELLTMREYIQREDWKGELYEEEAERWL